MKFIYCDTALVSDVGHNANSCRAIAGEFRRRGVPTRVFGLRSMAPDLRAELEADVLFRIGTYGEPSKDPLCGWLKSFTTVSDITVEDLNSLPAAGPDDLVYINSVWPAQWMAVITWMARAAANGPTVIVEFGTETGLVVEGVVDGRVRHVTRDARPLLYRYAATFLTPEILRRLRLVTFDPMASDAYSLLLQAPVATLPLPQVAKSQPRDRRGASPITVGILGHQRQDKGFHLVPEIIRQTLARLPRGIRFLVHNGAPHAMVDATKEVTAMAAADPRIVFRHEVAGPELWGQLLDQSDLILLPYSPERFTSSYSAVATEAIANGIPLVSPEGTSISALMAQYGLAGSLFKQWAAGDIANALCAALNDFETLAGHSMAASGRWAADRHGAAALVDAMLALAAPVEVPA